MEGLKLFEKVFAEDIKKYGDLSFAEIEEVDDVEDFEDEIDYIDEWYAYHIVTFKYKDKMYTFEYKSHVSDNVCDTQYFVGTFKERVWIKAHGQCTYADYQDPTLNKDTFTQAEVVEILKLSPYEIHQLLKEVEESAE